MTRTIKLQKGETILRVEGRVLLNDSARMEKTGSLEGNLFPIAGVFFLSRNMLLQDVARNLLNISLLQDATDRHKGVLWQQ